MLPEELAGAAAFHTHLGPFLVVGLRMGRAVTRTFGSEPFTIKIRAHTGKVPPYSCLVDGIQYATPCTVGNGGVEVTDDRRMAIEARCAGRTLSLRLREDLLESIERDCTEENQEDFACRIWRMPEEDVLETDGPEEESMKAAGPENGNEAHDER